MRSRKILFFVIFLPAVFSGYGQSLSKIKKAFESGDIQKTLTLVSKSLEKDTLAFGSHYFLSLICLDSSGSTFSRDSSKYWVEKGLEARAFAGTAQFKAFEKAGMSPHLLDSQYSEVVENFYRFSLASATLYEYNSFLSTFPQSPQAPEILFLRDSLAFSTASENDTWEAYENYMTGYPTSVFYDQAKRNYEIRLFKDMTGDGSLSSYIRFLEEYPETPFRRQVEESIFSQTTNEHTPDKYREFLDRYPNSHLKSRAANLLYYLGKEDPEIRSYIFKIHPNPDSLRLSWELDQSGLLPLFTDEKFVFFDPSGEELKPAFDEIPQDYLCSSIANEWLVGAEQGVWVIKNRGGALVADSIVSVKFLGTQAALVDFGVDKKVLHKSGFDILGFHVSEASLLGGKWIGFRKDLFWGLAAFNGEVILQPTLKGIEEVRSFFILENQRGRYVTNIDHILTGKGFQERLLIDDVEVLSDTLLLGFRGDKETLINNQLETPIPLDHYKIYWQPDYCFVKRPNGISQLYSRAERKLVPNAYLSIYENENWRLTLEGVKWQVSLKKPGKQISQIDSLVRLSYQHLLIYKADSICILFPNGRTIIPGKGTAELMASRNETIRTPFLILTSAREKTVFDQNADPILRGSYDQLFYLNDTTFVIKSKGKEGVITRGGKTVLRPEYDLIEGHGDLVVLLKKNLIGCLDLSANVFIPTLYHGRVLKFGQFYEVFKDGKKGLITGKNKMICPTKYDELLLWNDTSFWARHGIYWSLISVEGEVLFENISEISPWDSDPDLGLYVFLHEGKYGIFSKQKGMLLPPQYNDILNLGTGSAPVFFAEEHLKTADFFVVTYFNSLGEAFRSHAFRSDEYDKIYCDESVDSGILVE